jgi:YidC/Oxa1 family membrane protein insertase
MFKFFAKIFGYVLNFIYGIVNNYGLAIIIFTVLLRLILLPINWKQQKTMKKSAKLQEKMKELQDKYSNDPVRLNEEVRNLYASENMSPFSGCLGSILQFIIIISMFWLVSQPLTYMKQITAEQLEPYKAQVIEENGGQNVSYTEIAIIKTFANINADDLNKTETDSAENTEEVEEKNKDEEDKKYDTSVLDSIHLNMNFLGLDLSDVPSKNYDDPKVFIIPLLYVLTSILSMKLTMAINSKKKDKKEKTDVNAEDEKMIKANNENEEIDTMESMNKSMRYMMPIMTVSIALIAPLGLALYWFISNLLMILERLAVNKFVKGDE